MASSPAIAKRLRWSTSVSAGIRSIACTGGNAAPADLQQQAGRDDAEQAALQRGIVLGNAADIAGDGHDHRDLPRDFGLEQHLDMGGGREYFRRQHADVPVLRAAQRVPDQVADHRAQLVRRGQPALRQPLQVGHVHQAAVRLGQHGLVKPAAAAEVIVDRGQVHLGARGDGLAGGFGVTMGGEQFAGRLEYPCAGRFAVRAWRAGCLLHES